MYGGKLLLDTYQHMPNIFICTFKRAKPEKKVNKTLNKVKLDIKEKFKIMISKNFTFI
jgi:hypothetical protein